jgi:hypothetical protein
VGTITDPCHRLGWLSDKRFILSNGEVIPATEIAVYSFDVRLPANKLHITPGISQHLLLSTGKFANANYITGFYKEMVNIYDTNDTMFTISIGAILLGFRDSVLTIYQIPLVDMVRNNNNDTIVNHPPTEFLPDRPHSMRQSTTFTNQKLNWSWFGTITHPQDSPPNPHGLPPSRTSTSHLGRG